MFNKLAKKIFGSRNERTLRRMQKTVAAINALEPQMQALSDDALRAKTDEFRRRLQGADGQRPETLDQILPEVFAVTREVAMRTLHMRHFDVQLIGGMVLHEGKISEMRTGEGKTLMSTLPTYLNALTSKGVHIVTVNDYLAKRDAAWMNPIYEFLGMSVGVIVPDMPHLEKQAAYAADITYGTNNEFGFDYLRDNMAFSLEDKVQRDLHYAVVDEVDSILIDEARTPLIISGPAEESSELYQLLNRIVPQLMKQEAEDGPGDYSVDEKTKQAYLTEAGHQKVEEILVKEGTIGANESLYDAKNITYMHHLSAALRAHALFHRDVDYVVQNGQIVIVDEHTGRTMQGRRWSEGLHQAVEAKEGVAIQSENQTLASITFQNYFRLYEKLSGMTGTADTEAYEFQQIYGLEVIVIPTNKPMIRDDRPDQIYMTQKEKFVAITNDIKEAMQRQQPVLVGTASIETSEFVSEMLNKEGIKHQVLNAKFHEKEAQIIAEAGRPGNVTIATNMAGRGTDIVLGGNLDAELETLGGISEADVQAHKAEWQNRHETVLQAGGLYVLGTERHESRRIDNQLRGRSGRQGDPGLSRFYLSLEDNLMRIFASDRVAGIMRRIGLQEGDAIEHSIVSKAIENAQRKVEGFNFDMRKQLLQYDDVANDQRKVIYSRRAELMAADDISEALAESRHNVLDEMIEQFVPPDSFDEQWDVAGLQKQLQHEFNLQLPLQAWLDEDEALQEAALRERIWQAFSEHAKAKEAGVAPEIMRQIEKSIMLQALDSHWREHLAMMDHLRQGIHLRGYAQKNPTQEYKREAFILFSDMLGRVEQEVVATLCTVQIHDQNDVDAIEAQRRHAAEVAMQMQHAQAQNPLALENAQQAQGMPPGMGEQPQAGESGVVQVVREGRKVGRNEPCPCGSGKKYKQCHGRISH